MTLAATVFFAIKHAVLKARKDQGDSDWFPLACPATVQRIATACQGSTAEAPRPNVRRNSVKLPVLLPMVTDCGSC